MKQRMGHILWSLAEDADWKGWRPRRFWQGLLTHYDKKQGYNGSVSSYPGIIARDAIEGVMQESRS